jgi:phosphopantothenoylcysteine decarboxylase/phosphopantothenate--cysteine ligase
MLRGRHILVGVTGGIAAYKSALLVREFVKAGADVRVVMTRSATEFITPLTLATLSKHPVVLDMFPPATGGAQDWTAHIGLGQWADAMLIAPATANTLAKIAAGMADNFLTSLVLALRCPLVVAPAMDMDMYGHPATQHNLGILRDRGVRIVEPAAGELASGLEGPGRLPEPDLLVKAVVDLLAPGRNRDLAGRQILVTAGPTQEPLDPVRYLGNRSSGKMGFAVARAAAARGAAVTLVSGPTHLDTPPGVRRIDVGTADEMSHAVTAALPGTEVLVMAAAVADFAPAAPSTSKIKRDASGEGTVTITLRKNPDILRAAGQNKGRRIHVGFALETENDLANARTKLDAKHLDLIVLNNPTVPGAAFGADTNVVTIVERGGGATPLARMSKDDVAHEILDRVAALLG